MSALSALALFSLIFLGGALLCSTGCVGNRQPGGNAAQGEGKPVADMTAEARAWADSVLGSMTLEERIGQTLFPALYSVDDRPTMRAVATFAADLHAGGLVLLKGDRKGAQAVSRRMRDLSTTVPFIAIDAEWGLGMRLSDMPVYPENGQIGDRADPGRLYDYGAEMARQCRETGISMVLGPVADVALPGSPIGLRSFGGDARRVAALVAAYARGLEDGNVLSVAKHFPGHGSPGMDSHKGLPVVTRTREEIDSLDLPPFRAYVESGMSGIMAGHLAVPALDASLTPASFSRPILTTLLRDEMGFGGLVLTDAINMRGAGGHTAADALAAGADIILAPPSTIRSAGEIKKALEEGRLSMARLNDAVSRILFFKYLFLVSAQ